MEYPSTYELLIYSLGGASLLTFILPRLKRTVKKEMIFYKGIGPIKVKEKRLEITGEHGIRSLIWIWILSIIYILIGPLVPIPDNIHMYINIFLWTVTCVASLLCAHAFFLWVSYS